MMNFCTSCGTRLVTGLRFCTSCGSPLAAAPGSADATYAGSADAPTSSSPSPPSRDAATRGLTVDDPPGAPPAADSSATDLLPPLDGPSTAEQALPSSAPAPLWEEHDVDVVAQLERRQRGVMVAAVAVAAAALLVVVVGFVVHLASGGSTVATTSTPTGKTSVGGSTPSKSKSQSPSSSSADPIRGTAEPGLPASEHDIAATADITAPASTTGHVDASGRAATYPPEAMTDTAPSTAWRMDGDGTGQKITLSFPRVVTVTGLALDPGFDKVGKHEDRWPENRRISTATFTADDGSAFTIGFVTDPRLPASQRLQTFMLPTAVTTRTISVQIDATDPAARGIFDTTAISRLAVLGS
jgi:hypothetical protein